MKATLFGLALFLAIASAASEKKVVCYFGSWSVYRKGDGQFDVSFIDPKLCTHMIYTFVGVTADGNVRILDAWNDLPDGGGKDNFNRFNKLRELNPDTKTLIAIGGWNEQSINFSPVVANPQLRQKFVENIVAFVKKHGFDGFDVDWEYPAQRDGSSPADKQNFVLFLKELKERFNQEGLILSAAVAAAESSASKSYDIAEISKHLDFINLMAYDLHGVWDGKTGMNAPLYPRSSESGDAAKLNIDAVVHYWLSQGAPAEKLILGVPFYGRGFTLSNPQSNGVGAPSSVASNPGPYTQEAGMLGYNEICEQLKTGNWQVKFDEEQKVPYAVNGNQWVGYDDEKSLKEKTDYIKELGLGGAMIWSIETDDFRGNCGESFPLLKTLNRELRSGASVSSKSVPNKPIVKQQSQEPKSQQPEQPQYEKPQEPQYQEPQQPQNQQPQKPANNGEICQAEGYVRDRQDCSIFYYCQSYNGEFVTHQLSCPQTLVYDESIGVCNYPEAVSC